MFNLKFRCFYVILVLTMGSHAFSQSVVPIGAYTAEQQSALAPGNNTFTDGRYYQNLAITMEKGEAAMFYMRASLYEPLIYTVDNNVINWVNGDTKLGEDNIYTSVLTLFADKDTTFNVVYSSVLAGATGDFIYGMRKLSATQMQVPPEGDFCARLIYFINQWQAMWYLIGSADNFVGKTFTESLVPGNHAGLDMFFVAYEDLMTTETAEEAKNYYTKKVSDIQNCLDMNSWVIETEEYISDIDEIEYYTTYFNVKDGTGTETFLQSFAVILEFNEKVESKVTIEFY